MDSRKLTNTQEAEWYAVNEALQNGIDLENALSSVNDPDFLKTLTGITGSFVSDIDREFAYHDPNVCFVP